MCKKKVPRVATKACAGFTFSLIKNQTIIFLFVDVRPVGAGN